MTSRLITSCDSKAAIPPAQSLASLPWHYRVLKYTGCRHEPQRLFIALLALCGLALLCGVFALIWLASTSWPPVGHGN